MLARPPLSQQRMQRGGTNPPGIKKALKIFRFYLSAATAPHFC
jgi:hypothetical protein